MQTATISAGDLWDDVVAVRARNPLVHNITNLVVMNYNANVLLALGASPVMAHAEEEVAAMASIAQALVVNIGTLDPRWVGSMKLAVSTARARGTPVVLDPVGAGATPYRNQAVAELLAAGPPDIVRGNGSEILSVAGQSAATRGVDSAATSGSATDAAQRLAREHGAVVCVSGADDHVVDAAGRWVVLSNGDPWMTKVTGVGCSATAMIGAFAAVQPDRWRATAAAMAYLGVVGEWAADRVRAAGGGIGSYQVALLDGIFLLDEQAFRSRLRMTLRA